MEPLGLTEVLPPLLLQLCRGLNVTSLPPRRRAWKRARRNPGMEERGCVWSWGGGGGRWDVKGSLCFPAELQGRDNRETLLPWEASLCALCGSLISMASSPG